MKPSSEPTFIEQKLHAGVAWIQEHQERFWSAVGVVVIAAVLVVFAIRQRHNKADQSWMALGQAQSAFFQTNWGAAQKDLAEWEKQYAGSAADTYARFMKAELLSKTSDYMGAAQIYSDLSVNGRPEVVQPLALSARAASLEMAGQWADAKTAANAFIEQYPDHFLAADAYLSQARLQEKTGDPTGSKATYEKFVILYPQHPTTALVRKKLNVK